MGGISPDEFRFVYRFYW